MSILHVPLCERSYDVHIASLSGAEVADRIAAALGQPSGTAVLLDEHVARVSSRARDLLDQLHARLPGVRHLLLPRGEACKTLAQIERTTQWLAESGYDRSSAVVGIGGGATTDHAGFVAAVYLRGVKLALCPTTLLAAVDASVGGKTGVDLPAGKNLVGAFHQPRVVVADLGFLATVPARELHAGMAEVIKAGLVGDADLFARLEREAEAAPSPASLAALVPAAVAVKIAVVAEDEREGGRRAILNFGHTVGHALEAASGYQLLHGEAVALGMVAALALGEARGVTTAGLRARVVELLGRLGLPVDVKSRLDPDALARIEVDKKRRADAVRFVFVPSPGEATLVEIALPALLDQLVQAL
ncbi:MAG: 3-dehydroquinate synthase [Polyangia bacterium]